MYLALHVRDRFNAQPVSGLPVPLRRHSDDGLIATQTTDASGLVTFQLNGNVGDCYAVVEQGGETRIYSTRTTAPSGAFQVGEAGDFLSAVGPGVVDGLANGMQVSPSGMGVSVASGGIWLSTMQHRQYTPQTLTIPTANPTNPRIDLIVARADRSNRTSTLAVVQGVASGTPVAPALTQGATVWEEALATVSVDAGVTTIVAGKVVDARRFASARIADGTITSAKLGPLSVITAKLADLGVTAAKIADLAVTTGKIALKAVTAAQIADKTITAGQIADATLTETQFSSGVVTKLNATTSKALIQSVETVFASFGNTTSTTGIVVISRTITIPNDGTDYDIVANGTILLTTNAAQSKADMRLSFPSQSGAAGAKTTGWFGVTTQNAYLPISRAATNGPYRNTTVTVTVQVRTDPSLAGGGAALYSVGALDVYAVPR